MKHHHEVLAITHVTLVRDTVRMLALSARRSTSSAFTQFSVF